MENNKLSQTDIDKNNIKHEARRLAIEQANRLSMNGRIYDEDGLISAADKIYEWLIKDL